MNVLLLSLLLITGGSAPDPALAGVASFGQAAHMEATGALGFCSATLIRPDAALVSTHCVNSLNGQQGALRFETPAPGSGVDFFIVRIDHYYWIEPGYPTYIAYLEAPVRHITPIPPSFTLPTFDEPPVILAGWGKTGWVIGEGPQEFRQCETFLTAFGLDLLYWLPFWNGGACGPNSGDSGGPVLRERQGDRQGYEVIGVIQYGDGGTSLARYVNDPNYNGGVD